jgi:phosphate uptake regulator
MDFRKIIEFGKSSYVVSLPKVWLKEKNLAKGDVVYLAEESSRLVLYPAKNDSNSELKKVTIDVTNMSNKEIRLQVISKYIRNFNEITLMSKNMKSKAKDVRSIVHDLMALEVVEEDATKIVTKDFINMEDIQPVALIQKMDKITREMIVDSKDFFKENKYFNLKERDADVNRLSYLVIRAMKYLQDDHVATMKKGLEHDELITIWMTAVKIEKIADQVKWITKLLKRTDLKKPEQDEFFKLYSIVEKYYHDSMKVFYAKDQEAAFKLVARSKNLNKLCRDFHRQNWNYEWVPSLLEKLKTMIGETKGMLTYVCDLDLPISPQT